MKSKTKVLILSSGDTYGAYEYMYRMAKAMITEYDVFMLVKDKNKTESWIRKVPILAIEKSFLQRVRSFLKRTFGVKEVGVEFESKYVFLPNENESTEYINIEILYNLMPFNPDVIISGMTDGFVNTNILLQLKQRTNASIYQAMIDVSMLTGGCHVVWNCSNFTRNCENCPAILNEKYKKFASENLRIKRENIEKGNFKLMLIPGWSLGKAQESSIYKTRFLVHSCNIIDTTLFSLINRKIAKQVFNIPSDSKVIFAGSNNAKDIRKGRNYLVKALNLLWDSLEQEKRERVFILLAGNHNDEDEITAAIQFKKILIPFIKDERLLSLAYQASEVYVCPSLEDAGPMMVAEALACGTPVVGFETGSLYDDSLVENGTQGYRCKMKDITSLSEGIRKVIDLTDTDFQIMSENARLRAQEMSSEHAFLSSIKKYILN